MDQGRQWRVPCGRGDEVKERLTKYGAEVITFSVEVVERFFDDQCPQLAAALAYYAIFSIPPLLVVVMATVGTVFEASQVEAAIVQSASKFLSPRVTTQLVSMVEKANEWASSGAWWSIMLSILGIVFAATRGFVELQVALNRAWGIRPDPRMNVIKDFLVKRLVSFATICVMIVFLVISIVVSAVVERFGDGLQELMPSVVFSLLEWTSGSTLSIFLATAFLSSLYRFLPDAKISWDQVVPGALVTAILFEAIKSLFTYYLARLRVDDVYGQAGSFAALLVWLYLCALLVAFGAELTQVWSRRRGKPVQPEEGTVQERPSLTARLTERLEKKWKA